ncbi:hypothetical protein CFOL_v3_08736 [Cephalotus follicularis]|uniref:Uncharacterized protein n=1 Tax=Cephalotus follicularis TaxID=3775 RepID=A0A1Q3BB27_CEPFO|nr:hypothetical protein CFOL_v3_08736 [Cephalotus follicularis]
MVRLHLMKNGILPNYGRWHVSKMKRVNFTDDGHLSGDDTEAMITDVVGSVFVDQPPRFDDSGPSVPDAHTRSIFEFLSVAEKLLYPNCKKYTKLSAVNRLLQLKSDNC